MVIVIQSKTRNFPMTQNAPALNTFDTAALSNVKSHIFKSFSFMCSFKCEKQLSQQRVIMY